jgi:hypothetical protein
VRFVGRLTTIISPQRHGRFDPTHAFDGHEDTHHVLHGRPDRPTEIVRRRVSATRGSPPTVPETINFPRQIQRQRDRRWKPSSRSSLLRRGAVLFASIIESGASVETVMSDHTGLGRLETLRFGSRVLGHPRVPHCLWRCHCCCSFLSLVFGRCA